MQYPFSRDVRMHKEKTTHHLLYKDLVSGKLRNDPYLDETVKTAYNARDTELKQGSRDGERSNSLSPHMASKYA